MHWFWTEFMSPFTITVFGGASICFYPGWGYAPAVVLVTVWAFILGLGLARTLHLYWVGDEVVMRVPVLVLRHNYLFFRVYESSEGDLFFSNAKDLRGLEADYARFLRMGEFMYFYHGPASRGG